MACVFHTQFQPQRGHQETKKHCAAIAHKDFCRLEIPTQKSRSRAEHRGLIRVELELDESKATIERDPVRCVLSTNIDGRISVPDAVTRSKSKNVDELIVRVLKQPGRDKLLLKVLPVALEMAKRSS